MTIDRKQRNFLLLCGGILAAYYVERSIEDSARQAAYYRQQTIRAARQRAAAQALADAAQRSPGIHAAPGAPDTAHQVAPALSGNWRGRTAIPGRGICTLSIELYENEPARFSAFSNLGCSNYAPLMPAQERNPAAAVLNRLSPATAVLSGRMENGSIRFHVDKTLAANSNGCFATAFTLTPFGTNQLAAEWQEAGCQGGHMILQKGRN
jgi:hypothetical protein